MPKTTAELLDLLKLDRIDDITWQGGHASTLMQRTYGGQVLAQSLVAGQASVPDDKLVHSLHAYFIKGGRVDQDISFSVQAMRDGTSFATRRITASQGDPIFAMSCSYHVAEPGLDHSEPMPTGIPDPDDCPGLMEVLNRRFGSSPIWHEWDALDVRFAGDSNEEDGHIGNKRARMQVWVRTEGSMPDDPVLHRAVLAYLSDLTLLSVATLPHRVVFMSPQLQTASIDHAMWFHRPARADQWLLYDMVSPSASNSIGHCAGRLFQDGHVVASCEQEGLIRIVENRPILT